MIKYLKIKEDISTQEAAALSLIVPMIMSGVKVPGMGDVDLQISEEEFKKLVSLCSRHFDGSAPPFVDKNGKRHFNMDCQTGSFGMAGSGLN